MAGDNADVFTADNADVFAADNADVLAADTTDVLAADKYVADGKAVPRGALWEEQEEPVVLPEEPVVLLEHQEAARQIFFMSEIAESQHW